MIYFIRNITSKAIKIGRSNNGGESRLSSLSTGSTSDLEVIFNWDAPDAMEADLHQRFAYCRIPSTNSKKEWFYSDPCLEGFIEGLQFASKFTNNVTKTRITNEDVILVCYNPTDQGRLQKALTLSLNSGASKPLGMHDHKGDLTIWWSSEIEANKHAHKVQVVWENLNECIVIHRLGLKGKYLFSTHDRVIVNDNKGNLVITGEYVSATNIIDDLFWSLEDAKSYIRDTFDFKKADLKYLNNVKELDEYIPLFGDNAIETVKQKAYKELQENVDDWEGQVRPLIVVIYCHWLRDRETANCETTFKEYLPHWLSAEQTAGNVEREKAINYLSQRYPLRGPPRIAPGRSHMDTV